MIRPGLVGHGYIGSAIAWELEAQGIPFYWQSHKDPDLKGDIIINAAGFTGSPNVDQCEEQRRECIDGNVTWPLECERRAQTRPVIHIGSGCVYDGSLVYRESDLWNFSGSFYSLCKALSQDSLAPYLRQSYLLRMRMPFSKFDHPKNLLTKLRGYPRLVNHRNSITCLEDAAKVVVWFAQNRPEAGIYNATNPGSITTREIADMLGLHKQWFAHEAEFRSTIRAPRSQCVLNTARLERIYPMPPVERALKDAIGFLRQKAA